MDVVKHCFQARVLTELNKFFLLLGRSSCRCLLCPQHLLYHPRCLPTGGAMFYKQFGGNFVKASCKVLVPSSQCSAPADDTSRPPSGAPAGRRRPGRTWPYRGRAADSRKSAQKVARTLLCNPDRTRGKIFGCLRYIYQISAAMAQDTAIQELLKPSTHNYTRNASHLVSVRQADLFLCVGAFPAAPCSWTLLHRTRLACRLGGHLVSTPSSLQTACPYAEFWWSRKTGQNKHE